MKKIALVIALATASLSSAQAQDASAQKPMRFLLGGGLTFGGDKLVTAKYDNDVEMDVRAGGMIALNAGIDYRVTDTFAFQATLGYHFDSTSATNADARFTRIPLELLAYYYVSPQWRVGGGVRYVSNPKVSFSERFRSIGAADQAFDNSVGAVLEGEYLLGRHVGIKLRYVHETYEGAAILGKADGSHVGILANYYF